MKLIGIEIYAGGRWKFVGKVGTAPHATGVPLILAGQTIFYRAVPWKDVYSTATKSLGIDQDAWNEAKKLGAKWLVIYAKAPLGKSSALPGGGDDLYYIGSEAFDKFCYPHDLGELVQLRLKPAAFFVQRSFGIEMGHTNNVRQVRHVAHAVPLDKQAPATVPTDKQQKETAAALTGDLFKL